MHRFPLEYTFFSPTVEGLCSSNGLRFYFVLPRIRSYRNYPAMAQVVKSLKIKVPDPGTKKLRAPEANKAVC